MNVNGGKEYPLPVPAGNLRVSEQQWGRWGKKPKLPEQFMLRTVICARESVSVFVFPPDILFDLSQSLVLKARTCPRAWLHALTCPGA